MEIDPADDVENVSLFPPTQVVWPRNPPPLLIRVPNNRKNHQIVDDIFLTADVRSVRLQL